MRPIVVVLMCLALGTAGVAAWKVITFLKSQRTECRDGYVYFRGICLVGYDPNHTPPENPQ